MYNMILLIICTTLLCVILGQPEPRIDLMSQQHISEGAWSCTLSLVNEEKTAILTTVNFSNPYRSDADLGSIGHNNEIGWILWQGSSCNCWLVLFQQNDYEGKSLGLWLGGQIGRIDLSR